MHKIKKYKASDLMSNLICDNYPMLLVMSRFGIDLGFGEETIQQTCSRSNVSLDTFLAVVNILIAPNKEAVAIDYNKISLLGLVEYLHNSHSYFLEYRLPSIRCELVDALQGQGDAAVVMVSYFDEYLREVHNHMMYEENTLFPYIRAALNGEKNTDYCSDEYSEHHDCVEARLTEFKNIIIKYYPAKTTHALSNVLYNIFSCEQDLASHGYIEDLLLVPTIKCLESKQ